MFHLDCNLLPVAIVNYEPVSNVLQDSDNCKCDPDSLNSPVHSEGTPPDERHSNWVVANKSEDRCVALSAYTSDCSALNDVNRVKKHKNLEYRYQVRNSLNDFRLLGKKRGDLKLEYAEKETNST